MSSCRNPGIQQAPTPVSVRSARRYPYHGAAGARRGPPPPSGPMALSQSCQTSNLFCAHCANPRGCRACVASATDFRQQGSVAMTVGNERPSHSPTALRANAIGLGGAVIMSAAIMGPAVSTFFNPQFSTPFSGAATPFVYFACLVAMLITASGVMAMAARLPSAGAFYTYVTRGLGPRSGFVTGGLMFVAYALAAPRRDRADRQLRAAVAEGRARHRRALVVDRAGPGAADDLPGVRGHRLQHQDRAGAVHRRGDRGDGDRGHRGSPRRAPRGASRSNRCRRPPRRTVGVAWSPVSCSPH